MRRVTASGPSSAVKDKHYISLFPSSIAGGSVLSHAAESNVCFPVPILLDALRKYSMRILPGAVVPSKAAMELQGLSEAALSVITNFLGRSIIARINER